MAKRKNSEDLFKSHPELKFLIVVFLGLVIVFGVVIFKLG